MINYYKGNGIFWVRFLGYGFSCQNLNKQRKSFSQRIGKTKTLTFFNYCFNILKPC